MSSAARYSPHYTIDDYRLWKGEWELWHGTAVAMTPSPSGRHGGMLVRLCTALMNSIDQAECNASVLAEIDWIISEDTVVRPDASVVCGPPPEGHIESTPAIVVEVLSESTRERDVTYKRALYQEHGVPWYLIADPEDSSLTILRLSDSKEYEAVSVTDELALTLCKTCQLSVELGWLRQ
jgi:Uma2 family endonuclease